MWQVVRDYAHLLRSPIPDEISRKQRLMDIDEAVRQVHFPDDDQEIEAYQEVRSDAHRTLIYDEFFYFPTRSGITKKRRDRRTGYFFQNRWGDEEAILWIASLYPYGRPATSYSRNRARHGIGQEHESPAPGRCRFRKDGRFHGGNDYRL